MSEKGFRPLPPIEKDPLMVEGIQELLSGKQIDEQIRLIEQSSIDEILKENLRVYKSILQEKQRIAQEYGLSFDEHFDSVFVRNYRYFEINEPEGADESTRSGISRTFDSLERDPAFPDVAREDDWYFDWLDNIEKKVKDNSYTLKDFEMVTEMTRKLSNYLQLLREREFQKTLQTRLVDEAFSIHDRQLMEGKEVSFQKLENARALERAAALISEKKLHNPDLIPVAKTAVSKRTTDSGRYDVDVATELVWSLGQDVLCAKRYLNYGYPNKPHMYSYQVLGVVCDKDTYEQVLSEMGIEDQEL